MADERELLELSVQCFERVYNPEIHDGHRLSRLLETQINLWKKILRDVKMYGRQHTVTTPVIKWAQTKQKLFINFKLSHRQDSPPCSDARGEVFGVWGIGEVFGKF